MRKSKFATLAAALLPGLVLTLAACSSSSKSLPGAVAIESFTVTARVESVDEAKRQVILATADGRRAAYRVSKDVVNFNQIKPGDTVSATVTEELAVFVRKSDAPPSEEESAAVALAPIGAKPGGVVSDTIELKARITFVDQWNHKVRLQLPDDTIRNVSVAKSIDLSNVQVGDNVVVRLTEALALLVEKP